MVSDILKRIGLGEPSVLAKKRDESLRSFRVLALPSPKDEAWKYTDNTKLLPEILELGSEEASFVGNAKGVIFCEMKVAVKEHFNLLSKHMPMSLIGSEDKFTSLHSALWCSGVFIYIPKDTEADLKNIFSLSGAAFSHTTIIVDENSALTYTSEHKSKDSKEGFRSNGVEVFMKNNSRLKFQNFQDWNRKIVNLSNWSADLGRDAKVDWVFGEFGGKLSRVKIDTKFSGQGSESKTYGVFFGNGSQHFDITTDAFHNTTDTTCDILVKGVLEDATSIYRGKITIMKGAQRTNSYLSDHSLMFGDKSISNSIPSLQIDANEVKASHGATLGRPNEEEIFYIMARGMSRKDAERLIIQGYFSQVIDKIDSGELKEKFNEAVMQKISSG